MGTFFKILLFLFIAYFLFSWIRRAFMPPSNTERQPGVRIFKKGNPEKPSLDVTEAETVDFEEIKKTDELNS